MGFEQDYEQGLRDKHWGKSLRAIAEGVSSYDLGNAFHKSLCSEVRELAKGGLLKAFESIALQIGSSFQRMKDLYVLGLMNSESSQKEEIDTFDASCSNLYFEDDAMAKELLWRAIQEFHDCYEEPRRFVRNPEGVVKGLLVDFLTHFSEARLASALPIAARKCQESPETVGKRLAIGLSHAAIEHVAEQIWSGKAEKFRAKKSKNRLSSKELASKSLLKD